MSKKIIRILLCLILLPVVLVLLAVLALYCPPIQKWAVDKVAAYASEETGMKIGVEEVRLTFPLDLKLKGVTAVRPDSLDANDKDTIADIHTAYVDVQLRPLFDGNVMVDALDFDYAKINTVDLIKSVQVLGRFKSLRIASHGVELKNSIVRLDKVALSGADMTVCLADSVPEDTTETKVDWLILLEEAKISKSHCVVKFNGNELAADIDDFKANKGVFNLGDGFYGLANAELRNSAFCYPPFVDLEKISVLLDSVSYSKNGLLANIVNASLRENKYGVNVRSLHANVATDSVALHVKNCDLQTAYSKITADADMDFKSLNATADDGRFRLALKADVGKGDVLLFRNYLPDGILSKIPSTPLQIATEISGNLNTINIDNLLVSYPNALTLKANGSIKGLLHPQAMSKGSRLPKLSLHATLNCPNVNFITQFIDQKTLAGSGFNLPKNLPLNASIMVNGDFSDIILEQLKIDLPNHLAFTTKSLHFYPQLGLKSFTQAANSNLLSVNFSSPNIGFLVDCIDPKLLSKAGVKIPRDIAVKGSVGLGKPGFMFDVMAYEGGGVLKLKGFFNPDTKSYDVDAEAERIAVNHFMPSLGVGQLTAHASVAGKGFDIYSASTDLKGNATVKSVQYGGKTIENVSANLSLAKSNLMANINSDNKLVNGVLDLSANLSRKSLDCTLAGDISRVDFKEFDTKSENESKFSCGLRFNVDFVAKEGLSNIADNFRANGTFDHLFIESDTIYYPADVTFDVLSARDTTYAKIICGDLYCSLQAKGSCSSLLERIGKTAETIANDSQERVINIEKLWAGLPMASIDVRVGEHNPLSSFMKYKGLGYKDVDIHLTSEPIYGISGYANILGMDYESVMVDTIKLNMKSNETQCVFDGQVRNNKDNPQYVFNALFHGKMMEHGLQAYATINDSKDREGLSIGVDAEMIEKGLKLRILDDEGLVIGYQDFKVNSDNYIILGKHNRVSADMKMISSDGKGLAVYTMDDNTDALQDITLSVTKLNLQEILSAIPYAPDIRGVLEGDFHYIQDSEGFSVSSSSSISKLNYAGLDIGDFSSEFVYMPETDGGHHIDGILYMNDIEICDVIGSYNPSGEGAIDASVKMKEMPMHLANGFIPNHLFGLKGKGDGELEIKGTLAKPDVNGEIFLDSCYLYSVPYGIDMRFSNDPVRIANSRLLLENFEMYANNDNPLTIAGYLDFADLSDMFMDIRMKAENYGIIDSKENARSETYGKVFVDFYGTMKGHMRNLSMKGKLDVLSNTNVAYILRDSPLTTDNHLDELVKFVNVKDSISKLRVERPQLSGFKMDMTVSVTSGAQMMAYLNTNHSNYVDLSGDGQLRLTYNPTDQIKLTGRYNLAGGEMKYSLPVIPLKTFHIKNGSYIEFTGELLNPRLNIAATEINKAQVERGGTTRSVQFECGVVITKTLKDMGLEFTLEAPGDLETSADLATMDKEMRGKLAVTMLTTGMYLAEGNTGTFTMNSALTQFLQNEINNITGNALRSLDLSIGVDNSTDSQGKLRSDYSFKFAKRFFNNRLKVSIGGKVSTGGNVDYNQSNSIFDNVELEYRLDSEGRKYLNLYYYNNSYDWLDGTTQEIGAGFLWRKTAYTFVELFRATKTERKDSTKVIKSSK